MATSADTQVHVLAEASNARALLGLFVVVALPVFIALALAKSGYSVSDYPSLIATGQLSPFGQGLMWLGYALLIGVYMPSAITALGNDTYLASTATQLITPSGERFNLAAVKELSVRKTFWHKILTIELPDETRKVIVTFAKPLAPGIRDALKADSNLQGIPVT